MFILQESTEKINQYSVFSNLASKLQHLHKMCNIIIIHPFKNLLLIFMMVLLSLLFNVQAQSSGEENMPDFPQTAHPSNALVISVLTIMFAVTFLLLAYVKFCRISPTGAMTMNPNHNNNSPQNFHGLTRSCSRFSGIDKQVIETLPFFKFSSLRGSKEGLECTVCLSRFEDSEILRLLPKCQHAFHMSCIDMWLESHSTCPLCRYRVEPGDIKNFNFSLSSRFLRVPSNLNEDPNVEIYVQREPSHRGSSRFSVESISKIQEPLIDDQEGGGGTKWEKVHRLNHRIVISDVVTRSRWSDLNSSDLISLSFEMLNDVSSARFLSPLNQSNNSSDQKQLHASSSNNIDDEEENSFTALNPVPSQKRSMSEIANVPRFAGIIRKQHKWDREYSGGGDSGGREERLWRIWMPIARRTVQWFAGRERNNSDELQHKPLGSNV